MAVETHAAPVADDTVQAASGPSAGLDVRQVLKWGVLAGIGVVFVSVIGMVEAWRQTGDPSYLIDGLEQMQGFHAHGDLVNMDARLDCQHFFRAVYDLLFPS